MFPTRLTEVTAGEVQSVIDTEVAETIDFELKRNLPSKKGSDPWMTGAGRLGDDAKDQLATEIIAFANTAGGTLIVGIGEDTATKRAKPPLFPIRQCKDAAARLHQAISDKIEPKLPVFECEGVITEADGTSGVIIMRTLESYLAPHRHTQDRHCYIRRNDRAEPMSMLEIQELTRQKARAAEDAERTFVQSSARFCSWLPDQHKRSHPFRGVQGLHTEHGSTKVWVGMWAMRLTARPFSPLVLSNLPREPWLKLIDTSAFNGTGQIRQLGWHDWNVTRTWIPRLRGVEREFEGDNSNGLDRIGADGLIERFVRLQMLEKEKRPHAYYLNICDVLWNVASVMRAAAIVRAASSRPSQHFALEVEFMTSDPLFIGGYSSAPSAKIPAETVILPRYEFGAPETFDEVITTFDRDMWNLGGYHPTWELGVNWPKITLPN
jgi:hypothetical protein